MKHLGVKDPELEKIARAGPTSKRKQFRNICRNFHANLLRDGRQLKVTVSMIKVRVKVHRPKVRTIEAEYPYISLRSWSTFLLQHHPAHLLGGFDFEDFDGYTSMFDRFWTRYRQLDPTHEAFTQFTDSGHVIPYMVHGDEGRGKNKSPILICNYQPCIGVQGEEFTNMKGHSFSTRFLSFMMPSKHFAEDDKTLDDYTAYIVADLSSLFYDGVVAVGDRNMYEILRYTCDCCNAFFRRLYEYGTWMLASEAAILVPLGYGMTEGYAAMARLANDRSFKLYRMKPKLHMLDHITRKIELDGQSGSPWLLNDLCDLIALYAQG
ncbi:Uncharacterized protein SCF082_LOCUS27308 [Durusdinium trenchii]|uniref:Uncharacterized protein n=1 Tax=Durusdinium trenchii TaxID=1381693 RepID=A0ABP0MCP5_9DINO